MRKIEQIAAIGVSSKPDAADSEREIALETCKSLDEITVNLLAAGAPDDVLVAAAKSGDRDRPAFAGLWKRHSNMAFNKVYWITRNGADAKT